MYPGMIGQQRSDVGVTLVSPWFGFAASSVAAGTPAAEITWVVGAGGRPVRGSTAVIGWPAARTTGRIPGSNTSTSACVTTVSIAVSTDSRGLLSSAGPTRDPNSAMTGTRSASRGAPATT